MTRQKNNWRYVWGLTALVALVFGFIGIRQHLTFQTYSHDLGIFDQALWHLSRFETPASTVRQIPISNIFADHFHPILILLVPLYWLQLPAWILPLIQALLFAACVPVVSLLSRRWGLGHWSALALSAVIGCNPMFWLAMKFDFHEIAFAPALFLTLALFLEQRRWGWAVGAGLLILLTKETLGLYLAAYGLSFLFVRRWRVAAVCMIGGLSAFFLITQLVIPALSGGSEYGYLHQYDHLGGSPSAIINNAATHPLRFLQNFFNAPEKIATFFSTLGAFGFFPVLAVPFWPAFVLIFAERFLTSNAGVWAWQFQYGLSGVAFFTLAIGWVLQRIRRFGRHWLSLAVVVIALSSIMTGVMTKTYTFSPAASSATRSQWAEALRVIPKSSAVSAQNVFVPHLARRDKIYQFPRVRDAEWVILDPNAPGWPLTPDQIREQQRWLSQSSSWQIVFARGETTIYQRLNNVESPAPFEGWE